MLTITITHTHTHTPTHIHTHTHPHPHTHESVAMVKGNIKVMSQPCMTTYMSSYTT